MKKHILENLGVIIIVVLLVCLGVYVCYVYEEYRKFSRLSIQDFNETEKEPFIHVTVAEYWDKEKMGEIRGSAFFLASEIKSVQPVELGRKDNRVKAYLWTKDGRRIPIAETPEEVHALLL